MQDILVANGYVALPEAYGTNENTAEVGTVISNLAHYGYTLDKEGVERLLTLSTKQLGEFYTELQSVLAELSKENRSIEKSVVYKNFPREVLDMTEAELTVRQTLIYYGFGGNDYEIVAEAAEPRKPLGDMSRLKVLKLADARTPDKIFNDLVTLNNRWSDNQSAWASRLVQPRNILDLDDFGFKENGIKLIKENFETKEFNVSTGTDVLRLAAALSDADVSLREKVKLRSFKRPERRKLLEMMEGAKNLSEDFATRPEQFKRLLERLRPGDYNFDNVKNAQDLLYNRAVKPFSALVDPQEPTSETLDIVAQRPGEFLRRFHHFYGLFGQDAVYAFIKVMPKLTTRQLVNFRAYIGTVNERSTFMIPPKSNWARAQIVPNSKTPITDEHRSQLDVAVGDILRERLAEKFPEGIDLDETVNNIKLQTNDQKLAEYGRGTVFPIPDNINFIRTASYWEEGRGHVTWFDNGWNFFDENWSPKGTCSWEYSHQKFMNGCSVFSGDPVNTSAGGKATQMIDVYLDLCKAAGVRYAVWNILCYSRVKFSDAQGEVMGLLQWGENPTEGKLMEPSRCQMVFPLKAQAFSSYIVYIDVVERKLVYMDAPLKCNVMGASLNEQKLSETMPAYVEYLASLPTVHDLLRDAPEGTMPVRFTDRDVTIEAERAFVFRPENPENTAKRVSIADLLEA